MDRHIIILNVIYVISIKKILIEIYITFSSIFN